jgi:hypothetical protein
MATKEIKIINHLGKGFIGPLFLGVTVGVYLDTAIAKIETKISNNNDNSTVSEWIGNLKIGSES